MYRPNPDRVVAWVQQMLAYEIFILKFLAVEYSQLKELDIEPCRKEIAHATASLMMWLYREMVDPRIASLITSYGWPDRWDRFPKWGCKEILQNLELVGELWMEHLAQPGLTAEGLLEGGIEYQRPSDGVMVSMPVQDMLGHLLMHNPNHWGKTFHHLRSTSDNPPIPRIPFYFQWAKDSVSWEFDLARRIVELGLGAD